MTTNTCSACHTERPADDISTWRESANEGRLEASAAFCRDSVKCAASARRQATRSLEVMLRTA